tara:strand:- start:661 stop:996 length:336 start_codon:yes stop_codon:yes gene_type:complete
MPPIKNFRNNLRTAKSIAYYIMILALFALGIYFWKKHPKYTKLVLVLYLTMYLIYRLTTPTLKYRPWVVPDKVSEGPPIQLFYPENPFGFVARTVKNPNEKIPEVDFKLLY